MRRKRDAASRNLPYTSWILFAIKPKSEYYKCVCISILFSLCEIIRFSFSLFFRENDVFGSTNMTSSLSLSSSSSLSEQSSCFMLIGTKVENKEKICRNAKSQCRWHKKQTEKEEREREKAKGRTSHHNSYKYFFWQTFPSMKLHEITHRISQICAFHSAKDRR